MLLCTFGMGAFLAWTVGNAYTLQLGGISAASYEHMLDILFGICSNILVLLVVVICARRISHLADRGPVQLLCLAFSSTSPLLIAFSQLLSLGPVALVLGSMAKGVAAALLFLAWNELFCRLPLREVTICYGGAYLFSVVLQIVMELLAPALACALVVVCGACSSLMLMSAVRHVEPLGSAETVAESWKFPWQLMLLCVCYSFVAFMFRQLIAGGSRGLMCCGGGIVGLVCVLTGIFLVSRRFDISFFERLAMALIVCGILLWCWFGSGLSVAVLMLTDAGNTSFRIFILVFLCTLCYRYGVPSLWIFGLIRIAMMAAEGCGLGMSVLALGHGAGSNPEWLVHFCYVLVMALVVIAGLLRRPPQIGDQLWDVLPKTGRDVAMSPEEQLRAVMGNSELVLWKCGNVARKYGLTHREEEMLVCLAEGKSRSQIASELVLSESTVGTHLRHLYRKLGVHTKEDARAIVENAR